MVMGHGGGPFRLDSRAQQRCEHIHMTQVTQRDLTSCHSARCNRLPNRLPNRLRQRPGREWWRSRALSKVEILKLSFGTISHEPAIYFDFARDTLYFDDWMAACWSRIDDNRVRGGGWRRIRYPEGPMAANEMSRIERLAVSSRSVDDISIGDRAEKMLSRFANMKTFFVAFDEQNYPTTSRATIQFAGIPATTNCEMEELEFEEKCQICREKDRCEERLLTEFAADFAIYDPSNTVGVPPVPAEIPDIEFVVAVRNDTRSDLRCIGLGTAAQYLSSEFGVEYESDSDSDSSHSDLDWESTSGSTSDSNLHVLKITEAGGKVKLSLFGVNNYEEKSDDVEEEISEIIEDEKKFAKFVSYSGESFETLCFWVGSDYLERRADL
ncbi:uncharacterized protein LY89DRAFT_408936 [Mollisia scopiformis]|uniref:Uncharacterized protein n=1 Tax=Mollisia scopiformis TaxID=149040 RepID=A0A132B2I8_MOLSC|nr:uncharacterized protein LY89DRAFT_408936 [Mollisia scopiformis]KUJ06615.1 hypothetical protein LY89DRAFT_408936 [Mollisia scopiformis]